MITMALTRISKSQLFKLAGKTLTDEELNRQVTDLGMPVEFVNGDELGVEVTPNRPDMYSVEGLARALSSFLSVKTGLREYSAAPSGFRMVVDPSVKKCRPHIACAIARDVQVTDELLVSLIGLQESIHGTLGRKRRKVAIGFTDLDKLKPPFTYKAVGPEESPFVPIGETGQWTPARILAELKQGKEYGYILSGHKKYPMITDSAGSVVALPPIITGESVKVTTATRNLFIDVTGTSAHTVRHTLVILACALADRGARIGSVEVVTGEKTETTPDFTPSTAKLRLKSVTKLVGKGFSASETKALLERMGHGVTESAKKGVFDVTTAAYRTDILHETDLIEDVVIPFGYNNFETTTPKFVTAGKPSRKEEATGLARELMIGLGFTEALHGYITNPRTNFEKPLVPEGPCARIKNPLTENFTMFRTWCVPSMLETLSISKDERMPQKLFELGESARMEGEKPAEERKLCAAVCDPKASFNEMRSALESVGREMGARIELREASHPTLIPGRSAEILLAGKSVGLIGEVHPQALNNFGITQPVAVFEISLRALAEY